MGIDENIEKTIKELKQKMYKIQTRNWIRSKANGTGAAGRTLEELLGTPENSDVLPDYKGIEIKTKQKYSKYPMSLFSCAFDNKPLEMQRLLKIGGYPDKNHPEFNVFQISVNAINDKYTRKYKYKLYVNHKNKVVEMKIKNKESDEEITHMSWSFRELSSRLEHKLKYLMLVRVSKDSVNGQVYFKYLEYIFYKMRGFDTFISLIESGDISATFRLSYYHSGEKYGQIQDRGTSFDIKLDSLTKLFEQIVL